MDYIKFRSIHHFTELACLCNVNNGKDFAKTPEAVQERAAREITCPVWEVRGHMRHYKSGKAVYIAPYRKGKERGSASAVSGKEYVPIGGDHAGKD